MLKKKRVIKAMVFVAISMTFIITQGCAEKENTLKKSDDSIAKHSIDKEETKVHNHSHSLQSETGKRIIKPGDAKQLWVFPESKEKLGSGGLLQIYMDSESHPHASSGFAKYELGVGGSLPEHKHNKTEEIAYFLSGKGIVISYENNQRKETVVEKGYVWFTAPGEWHSFKNTGNIPLKLVFATIPNAKHGLLTFFKKVGAEPGKQATALSADEFAKLASENDLILKPVKIE